MLPLQEGFRCAHPFVCPCARSPAVTLLAIAMMRPRYHFVHHDDNSILF
jgi:hypothetical protein